MLLGYFCVNWGATRDKKGNKIYVPKDMTYPKFHKKYIESDKEYSAVKKSWKKILMGYKKEAWKKLTLMAT